MYIEQTFFLYLQKFLASLFFSGQGISWDDEINALKPEWRLKAPRYPVDDNYLVFIPLLFIDPLHHILSLSPSLPWYWISGITSLSSGSRKWSRKMKGKRLPGDNWQENSGLRRLSIWRPRGRNIEPNILTNTNYKYKL